jgi:alpha-ribazole phosphatase
LRKIYLIRHSITWDNLEKRYVGRRTDSPLCEEGRELARRKRKIISARLRPDILVVSPMKRCRETAEILFPGQAQIRENSLAEIDFGDFEGKDYKELSCNKQYQAWIDSGGGMAFPNGDEPKEYSKKCTAGFLKYLEDYPDREIAFVIHGGTIMALMSKLSGGNYYDWLVENCSVLCCLTEGREKLKFLEKF